jgi:hypothetical protein
VVSCPLSVVRERLAAPIAFANRFGTTDDGLLTIKCFSDGGVGQLGIAGHRADEETTV